MAATAANAFPRESVQNASRNRFPVAASTRIFNDTLVGINPATGYARGLVKGDKFVGLAINGDVDNRDGAAGDLSVETELGSVAIVPVAGLTGHANVTNIVYASDDNTLTLTAGDNVAVGVIKRYESATTAAVRFFNEVEVALA